VAARAVPAGPPGNVDSEDSASLLSMGSDEDSLATKRQDRKGEFADNDDQLEQVLLQRSSSARSYMPPAGDAVEMD